MHQQEKKTINKEQMIVQEEYSSEKSFHFHIVNAEILALGLSIIIIVTAMIFILQLIATFLASGLDNEVISE